MYKLTLLVLLTSLATSGMLVVEGFGIGAACADPVDVVAFTTLVCFLSIVVKGARVKDYFEEKN